MSRPLIAFAALFVLIPARADEPSTSAKAAIDGPIVELYKSGKLFDKREYKAVRAAFAERFEKLHADELKYAFGEDYEPLMAWLGEHVEIKQEFFNAIDEERDKIPAVLQIFRSLWKNSPEQLAKYWNLGIATAVVWDDPRHGVYDYRGHQIRTKSILPEGYLNYGPLDAYKYFLDHEKELIGRDGGNRAQALPWEFLIYVVDHRTPVNEREWAVKNYAAHRQMIGAIYKDIEYDKEMLRTRSESCKLNGKPYTLESIRQNGGVCAMQADFASRVAKSLAVPAVYVGGEGANLDLHAWVMWTEFKRVTPQQVEFSYLSYGQYPDLKFYTGSIHHPQTGEKILDRDMERTLAVVGLDRAAKRQADLVMRAYPWLRESQSLDVAKRLSYLDSTLKVSPYVEAAWTELAGMARAGEFKGGSMVVQIMGHVDNLFRTFRAYPDLSWKVFDDLVSVQPDLGTRVRQYEKIVAMYEAGGRPDLACDARLKLADLQIEQKRTKIAATGLAFTIEKFPNEGRYVPKLMTKLEDACRELPDGTKILVDFYLRVLPKIPPTRAGEVSQYCVKMHEQAIAFFKENRQQLPKDKKDTLIPQLESRLAQIKSGSKKS
jgi:hypothetical protein